MRCVLLPRASSLWVLCWLVVPVIRNTLLRASAMYMCTIY